MNLPEFGLIIGYNQLSKEIESAGRLGFDFIEIALEEPLITPEYLEKNKKNLKYLLKKYDLFSFAHAPLNTEFGTTFEKIRFGWISLIKAYIMILSEMELRKINIHAKFQTAPPEYKNLNKIFLDNCVKSFKEIVKFGKKYRVQILLENGIRNTGDVESIKYILDNVPNLGMTLDVAHAFLLGDLGNIKNFVQTFKHRINHCHMHDNHGKYDEHLPIGCGNIDYNSVVKMLKKINYNKTITLEVFTSKEVFTTKKDAVESREKIRKLWQK